MPYDAFSQWLFPSWRYNCTISFYWLKKTLTLNKSSYHLPPLSRLTALKTTFYLQIFQFNQQPSLSSQWRVIMQGKLQESVSRRRQLRSSGQKGAVFFSRQLNCYLHRSSWHTVRMKHLSAITSMISSGSIYNYVRRRRNTQEQEDTRPAGGTHRIADYQKDDTNLGNILHKIRYNLVITG